MIGLIITIFLLLLFIGAFSFSIYYIFFRKIINTCSFCNPNGSIIEKQYDSSIPTPDQKLVLLDLTPQYTLMPWCIKTWYAIRYVDQNGNYSKMGPWNPDPIIDSTTPPPSSPLPPDTNTCGGAIPIIGCNISDTPKYYINVHRQVSTFDPTSEGDIIGILTPGSRTVGNSSFNYVYIDGDNPTQNKATCLSTTDCNQS